MGVICVVDAVIDPVGKGGAWHAGEGVNLATTHGIFGLPLLRHITSVSAPCMPTPVVPAERKNHFCQCHS